MVAFISKSDEFRIWRDQIEYLVVKQFATYGIDFGFSSVPDQDYRGLYDDGVVPEAVAETILEDILCVSPKQK